MSQLLYLVLLYVCVRVPADKCPSRCRAAPAFAVVAGVRNVVASSRGTLIERPSPGAIRFSYQLEEAHIHFGMKNTDGSEHQISGRAFPAEVNACIMHIRRSAKICVCLISNISLKHLAYATFVHMIDFLTKQLNRFDFLTIHIGCFCTLIPLSWIRMKPDLVSRFNLLVLTLNFTRI